MKMKSGERWKKVEKTQETDLYAPVLMAAEARLLLAIARS
jgi:hypothetical protein